MDNQPLPALRGDLTFTVHQQNDGLWYAVQDPLTGKFLRLGHREYLLASALDGRRGIDSLVAALREVDPKLNASEEDVRLLVIYLQKMGLLIDPDRPAQADPSHKKIVLNPLYTRLPLIDGPSLEKVAAWVAPLITAPLVAMVAVLCMLATGSVLLNWEEFSTATSNLFVADGRLWWIAAWLVLKSCHELGHAVVAVKVGSQIRAAGISLIFLAPVPYVDISDLWTISNRWHRILCSAGGMLVEIALASIAALVALNTQNESLQYFCCAVATLGTVTTLAFNANPLIRFDGYFIVSDLLNRANLWTEGQQSAKSFLTRIFRPSKPVSGKLKPAFVLYGLACYQYRIVMLLTLAAWSILVWQGIGVALVAWGAYATVLNPWFKARAKAKQAAELGGPQQAEADASGLLGSAWGWGLAAAIALLMFLVPFPVQPKAPGVVTLREPVTVRVETEGFLVDVFVDAGQEVKAGDRLALLSDPELMLRVAKKHSEVRCMEESIHAKRSRGELAELQSDEAQLHSLKNQLEQLHERVDKLEVRAPADGTLVTNDLRTQVGRFFSPGEPVGLIAHGEEMEIKISVSQSDVENMRANVGQTIQVWCGSGTKLDAIIEKVEPRGSNTLQEPLLAATYDGPLSVVMDRNASGEEVMRLPTPRFDVRMQILSGPAQNLSQSRLAPGQMAWVRIPGSRANWWDALGRWIEKKWTTIEQSSETS